MGIMGDPILLAAEKITAAGEIVALDGGVTVQIVPTQEGTGEPSPENVRPISGWTGCNISVSGKNLIDVTGQSVLGNMTFEKNADGSWTVSGTSGTSAATALVGRFYAKAGITYRLSGSPQGGGSSSHRLDIRVDPDTLYNALADNGRGVSFTPDKSLWLYVYIRIVRNYTILNPLTFWPMISLETGNFEKSKSVVTPITWQSEAGTVYGGMLDVMTGVLTTCPYYESYAGETLVGPWISSMDVYAPDITPHVGAQVVDLGGMPTSFNITPIVQPLLDTNNIWADCGPIKIEIKKA